MHFCNANRHHAVNLLRVYAKTFLGRVIPVFADIEAEANAATEVFYDRAMNQPVSESEAGDGSEFAEAAFEHGFEVWSDLDFVRRQLLGLSIAGTYHLWERLLKEFLIRELPYISSTPSKADMQRADFNFLECLLKELGWDIEREPFYDDLNLLRLVANVVKHGDGASCTALAAAAPDMFEDLGSPFINPSAASLVLDESHVEKFAQAATRFFLAFPEHLPLAKSSGGSL